MGLPHPRLLIPDVLQKPVSGDLLAQAAALGFAHDVAGGGSELQALGAAVGEEGHLVFIGAAFDLPDIISVSSGNLGRKYRLWGWRYC